MTNEFQTPSWVQEVVDKFASGVAHAFILHFNVHDYTTPGVFLTTYLARMMAGRQMVAVYSRDRGITFPLESMREKFVASTGASQEQDAALSALRALGGGNAAGEQAQLPRRPAEAIPLLDRLLRMAAVSPSPDKDAGDEERETPASPLAEKVAAVVVEAAETILPAADVAALSPADRDVLVAISRWGRDPEIAAAGNPIFLVTPSLSDLHPAVRAASAKFEAIRIPLPTPEERLAFIEWYVEQRPDGFTWADDLDTRTLANVTAGLSLIHIEDILLRAEAEGELRPEMVCDRKEAIIRSEYGDVLEVMDPHFGFDDVGGLQHVKDFFTRSVIQPMREGRTRRVPMGVLMTGPSGTGKSIVAEAVAKEAGVNAVRLRVGGQIASKWQGEGERNLEKALAAIEGLSPVICVIGGTRVQMADGSTSTIASLYDQQAKGVLVIGIDIETLKLDAAPITGLQRVPAPPVLREILTKWGSRLIGTHDHRVLVNRDGVVSWVPMGKLHEGDYVAAPRSLSNARRLPSFAEMLPTAQTYLYDPGLIAEAKRRCEELDNVAAFARLNGISPSTLYDLKCRGSSIKVPVAELLGVPAESATILKAHLQSGSGHPLNLSYAPREDVLWDLCYLSGLVTSDGTLTNPAQICFVNNDHTLHARFLEIVKKMGELTIHRQNRGPTQYTTVSGKTLNLMAGWILDNLTTLHPDLIASFLKGYADGDGSFCKGYVRFCTTDAKRSIKLQTTCLILGIRTYREFKDREAYCKNLIVHLSCIETFRELIGFRQQQRRRRLASWKPRKWRTERLDVVPASIILRETFYRARKYGARTRSFAPLSNSLISDMLNGKVASRSRFESVVNRLKEFGVGTTALDRLANSQAVWQKVTRVIDHTDHGEEFVYDLTVDGLHSFIANGMLTHNCFIDEVDQAISRGGSVGGSQQDRHIFQRLLEWMSDTGHRGRAVVLAATNRPDLMDAALRRPGRFDKKIPFLIPDEEERQAIFAVMCRRYGLQVERIAKECVVATDGWTGAEIEAATVKAVELTEDEELEPAEALTQAVRRIRPSTADIEFMTLLAVAEVNDLDLLPPKYRGLLDNRKELQEKLETTRPVETRRGRREL